MFLQEPMKSFRLGQLVGDTGERCAPSSSSELQPRISVKDYAVLCDYERLQKDVVISIGDCGQLGGWNREMVPNIAGVRVEFVKATSYELAGSEAAIAMRGFHYVSPLKFV
jgi:hypothetical protein